VDVELLDQIDRLVEGLCPCGAEPRDGSAYCSYDCEPNHVSIHTDQRETGEYATPMRWRPDLVNSADDTDLVLIAGGEYYEGDWNAQVFRRGEEADGVWHLRLDDGCRFVGVDVDRRANPPEGFGVMLCAKWAALERELGNSRHVEADPWADVMSTRAEGFGWRIMSAAEIWARLGFPDRPAGIVSMAPVGTDLNDRTAWTDLGAIADDGLTWGDTDICTGPLDWSTTDRGPITMTLDNRYGAFCPSCADAGTVAHYDIEIDAPEGVPLLDALVAAESEAALRERARILAEQSPGLAFSGLGERIGDALEELGRTMRPAFEAFSRDVARRFAQPPPEPDHPMLAAIEARRNRNTGPEQRQRAPRQINPRRR
jgi:hypothetical protein